MAFVGVSYGSLSVSTNEAMFYEDTHTSAQNGDLMFF